MEAMPSGQASAALTDHREFLSHFAADTQGVAALGPSCSQHLPAVLGSHTCPETVLVTSFPVVGLKRPFHLLELLSNRLIKNTGHTMYHFLLLIANRYAARPTCQHRTKTSYQQCGQLVDKKSCRTANPTQPATNTLSTHVDNFSHKTN